MRGISDCGVFWRGRLVLLELKRSRGGQLSPAQKLLHPSRWRLREVPGLRSSAPGARGRGLTMRCATSLPAVLAFLASRGRALRGHGHGRMSAAQASLFGISRVEMLREVEREIALRRRVYPRWVEAGRLKLDRAERQIAVLEAVAALLARIEVAA